MGGLKGKSEANEPLSGEGERTSLPEGFGYILPVKDNSGMANRARVTDDHMTRDLSPNLFSGQNRTSLL